MQTLKLNSLKNDDLLGLCDRTYNIINIQCQDIKDELFSNLLADFFKKFKMFSECIAKSNGKEYTPIIMTYKDNRDKAWSRIIRKLTFIKKDGDKTQQSFACAIELFIDKFGSIKTLNTANKIAKFKLMCQGLTNDQKTMQAIENLELSSNINDLNANNQNLDIYYTKRASIKNEYKLYNPTKTRKNLVDSYNNLLGYFKFFAKNQSSPQLINVLSELENIKIHYHGLVIRRHPKHNNTSTT